MIVPHHSPHHSRVRASTLHEIVEYRPSDIEWKVTAGIWALGLIIYTLFIKIAAGILLDRTKMQAQPEPAPPIQNATTPSHPA